MLETYSYGIQILYSDVQDQLQTLTRRTCVTAKIQYHLLLN